MMGFDFIVFLIFMELAIYLFALFVKGEGIAVQTVKVIFLPEHHISICIKERFLCPFIVLEHQIFQSLSIIRTFTRQVLEDCH